MGRTVEKGLKEDRKERRETGKRQVHEALGLFWERGALP